MKKFMCATGALTLLLAVSVPYTNADPPQKPEVSLSIKTDRKRYDLDDTILIDAKFEATIRVEIQFFPGNGAAYFYIVLQSLDQKGADGKGLIGCHPLSEVQFVPRPFVEQRPKPYLVKVGTGLNHQLVIHLPRLRKLQEGRYELRIGYTLHGEGLAPLIKEATGQEPTVDSFGGAMLDGAFGGAVLSDPVTITIGPEKKK